ncbi:MAG: hypothetical protein M1820_007047 [Bogoriella megaspora]|nr:MAG: hypothetical protein M1820_007047 [Bogoriella megaspora]
MAAYDSDSSGADENEYTETNVLLGYASKAPTDDTISQLGGYPKWLDDKFPPSASLANCRVCNKNMSLLLQLNGDMPEHFPGHERRLYILSCRQKQCRRKDGSVRGFRGTRMTAVASELEKDEREEKKPEATAPRSNLGNAIFGGPPSTSSASQTNPFSTASPNPFSSNPPSQASNPFPGSSFAAKPPRPPTNTQTTADIPETFASKVRISMASPSGSAKSQPKPPSEPWPPVSSFPPAYPSYHLDADYETLSPEKPSIPNNAQLDANFDTGDNISSGGTGKEDKELFESTLDKTFQKFADRLAQNPEQVLRYEFRGQPLLYSTSDAVGKLLAPHQQGAEGKIQVSKGGSGIPRCNNCGQERVFEVQLTPQAIAELEAEETGLEGMEWGTIILGVCAADCVPSGVKEGEVGWVEEWVGVQWEEQVGNRGR